jgi:hypothetical protein
MIVGLCLILDAMVIKESGNNSSLNARMSLGFESADVLWLS